MTRKREPTNNQSSLQFFLSSGNEKRYEAQLARGLFTIQHHHRDVNGDRVRPSVRSKDLSAICRSSKWRDDNRYGKREANGARTADSAKERPAAAVINIFV